MKRYLSIRTRSEKIKKPKISSRLSQSRSNILNSIRKDYLLYSERSFLRFFSTDKSDDGDKIILFRSNYEIDKEKTFTIDFLEEDNLVIKDIKEKAVLKNIPKNSFEKELEKIDPYHEYIILSSVPLDKRDGYDSLRRKQFNRYSFFNSKKYLSEDEFILVYPKSVLIKYSSIMYDYNLNDEVIRSYRYIKPDILDRSGLYLIRLHV